MRGDQELARQALRMLDAGLSRRAICRELSISRSTLEWYRKHRDRYTGDTHQLDALGERESLPPAGLRWRCEWCQGESTEREGHPQCREAA